MGRVLAFFLALGSLAMTTLAKADEPKAAPLVRYTVVKGDTCASIALKTLGDASLAEIIDQNNPQLGPSPHYLIEGQVLMVPVPSPGARLELIRNRVEVQSKPAAPHAPLYRGNRVSTGEASAAEMSLRDDAVLSMGERSLVVVLGAMQTKRTHSADASLVNGTLRAHLADLAGRTVAPMAVATKWGEVKVGSGDVQVAVDEKHATRLAVYRGHSSLTAMRATTNVDEGFGSKAEEGRAPTPPRPLPPAPAWQGAAPGLILTTNVPASVTAAYGRGAGEGPEAAEWHVVLSRDSAFHEILVDSKVPASTTRLELKQLAEGGYFAHVSAIDDDHFEGPWGTTAHIVVARIKTENESNHYGSVEAPRALRCSIDQAPAAAPGAAGGELRYDRLAPHLLRCAVAASPETVGTFDLPAENVAPLRLRAHWLTFDRFQRSGEAVLELADGKGEPISRADAVITAATAGATITLAQAGFDPGRYFIKTQCAPETKSIRYTLSLRGLSVASNDVAIDDSPPPPPPEAPVSILEVGIGAGGAIAGGPNDFVGFHGDAHLGVRLPAGPGDVLISIKGLVERYGRQSIRESDSSVSTNPTSVATTNAGVGVPIGYRLGSPAKRLAPFVSAMPQFIFQSSSLGAPNISNIRGSATYFALAPALGVELRAGPGAFVLEGEYRFAWGITMSNVGVAPKGALGTLGYVIDL